ncbi:MAG: MarR family winged helix-turn-helix transcriptional regulator [Candidatus Thiodiazotropha sp.]
MPITQTNEPYEIIWLIRRLFRALSQRSNELLEASGLSAADRAVMEFLYPDQRLSVPEIAERYKVSRQHIQITINALSEKSLVVTRANPRHKRSPLFALSRAGRTQFSRILKRDQQVVTDLFSDVSQNHVRITRQTLQTLLDALDTGEPT